VSAALFVAWAVHDAEERVTMSANSRALVHAAPSWVPLPQDIRQHGLTQQHVDAALGLMAVVVGAAAVDGVRTRGRSEFFQSALFGFGCHGATHIAGSIAARRYTSGVVTAPIIVLPYWWWARRELARAGVPSRPADPRLALGVGPILIGVHLVARMLTRSSRRGAP